MRTWLWESIYEGHVMVMPSSPVPLATAMLSVSQWLALPHCGVVRIALSSPEWGGPKRENRTERDGTSKCYRWLAKDDLMTKTGYGYAKCLTVAGTATAGMYVFLFI